MRQGPLHPYQFLQTTQFVVAWLAGGSPAAGSFPCAAKESNQRKAAPVSRPVFTGSPCAACLDVATAQLDLAGHTKRALPWDSNSARRQPHIESSCSARHKGKMASRARERLRLS